MENTKKDDIDINEMYGKDAVLSKNEFIKKYNTNLNGLSSVKAQENIHTYGLNEVKQAKPKKWYNYFLESLFSPFNSILLGITFVLFYTDVLLPETPSYANIIVIIVLVLISSILEFFEEYRSNKAAEKLKELVATKSTVTREPL